MAHSDSGFSTRRVHRFYSSHESNFETDMTGHYIKIPALTSFEVEAVKVAGTTVIVSADFDMFLVRES